MRNILVGIAIFMSSQLATAQDISENDVRTLRDEIGEMSLMLQEMRAEIRELRQELQVARETPRLERLEEEQQLLSAKVDEQYQTKVESDSKYRVRLSGLVLFNMFSNKGVIDNMDFPSVVQERRPIDSGGSFGATLRQSMLGFEVSGPQIGEARVGADIHFDFAGGFPAQPDGAAFGLPRLRTGVVRLAWPATTVVAGQDAPFFSPLSPTSLASIALPAFSYAGNLWTWIPQVRLEQKMELQGNSRILVQGGILDPMTGEFPGYGSVRTPQAGEASRQPAYATRIAWSRSVLGQDLTLGGGAFYSRQNWGFQRNVDAWAGTADWTIPVSDRWELSGEFYRGRGLGGLGGGLGRSIVSSGPITDPLTDVRGLNSTGGWTQLKFRQTEKLEWNGAFGMDNSMARDLQFFPASDQGYYHAPIARNRNAFVNVIYRPRSDLLMSLEYRRLRTLTMPQDSWMAHQFNMSMGVLF